MFCNDDMNVVGMYYEGLFRKPDVINNIIPGKRIVLQREPSNKHDPNAVIVFLDDNPNDKLGYIKRERAARLAPILDRGSQYKCYVKNTYRPNGRFEIVINLTTFPVARTNPRQQGSDQPVIGEKTPVRVCRTPTGRAFRRISDFEKHRQKFNGKSGIYVIWNKDNKCCYVGQASDISRRWSEHYRLLSSRSHQNNMLQYDWTTIGSRHFRFDLLEEVPLSELDSLEKSWIARLNSFEKGYNATPDGQPLERHPQPPPKPPPPVGIVPPTPGIPETPPPNIIPQNGTGNIRQQSPSVTKRNSSFKTQIDEIYKEAIIPLFEEKISPEPVVVSHDTNISPTTSTHEQQPPTEHTSQKSSSVPVPPAPNHWAWLVVLLVFVAPVLLLSFVLNLDSNDNKTTYSPQQQINSASASVTTHEPVEPHQMAYTQQQTPQSAIEDKQSGGTAPDALNYPQQQGNATSVKAVQSIQQVDSTPLFVSSTVNSIINPIPKQPDPVVITIQYKLSKLGYETGSADGFAGRKTTEAIKSFQRDHNLIENGIISALLMEQINQIYNSGYPTISQSQAVSNSTERAQMVSEERRVNLEACLDGHYPMSCRRELLTPAETKQ